MCKWFAWFATCDDNVTPRHIMEFDLYVKIAKQLYDARSLFRLMKSVFEIKRIQIILKCKDTDQFTVITNVISRACYFIRYLFDNIYILLKIMCPGNIRMQSLSLYARFISRIWWLAGIVTYLIYTFKTLRKTYTDESDLKVAALD